MKKLILVFFVIGTVMVFFGCQEESALAPELGQNNQVANSLVAKKPAPSLKCTIVYVFVGNLGEFDAEGRLLVWDGEIHGDIEGQILWWFVLGVKPNLPDAAHVGFYEARWEIWDSDDLLLAGESAGTTAQPLRPEKDGIWRGKGIVTEASEEFADWIGRQVYEGGNVNWDRPFSGEGIFRIN